MESMLCIMAYSTILYNALLWLLCYMIFIQFIFCIILLLLPTPATGIWWGEVCSCDLCIGHDWPLGTLAVGLWWGDVCFCDLWTVRDCPLGTEQNTTKLHADGAGRNHCLRDGACADSPPPSNWEHFNRGIYIVSERIMGGCGGNDRFVLCKGLVLCLLGNSIDWELAHYPLYL